jgi:LacI family gluconate utilization system Gnt-I transcriptional repressor
MTTTRPNRASTAGATAHGRRSHGRVTLQDVAEAAGVTKITVSRYLREPERVAGETAARIVQAIEATGYLPNKQAGVLASGRSHIVAAIVPSLANSVFAETVQGLSDGLQGAGYELLLASSGYSMEREAEQIRAVLGWSPDALAVTGRHHTAAARAMLCAARDSGTPIVELWDWHPRDRAFVQIGFDHAEVGRAMARHLIERGCRRLAYVDAGVVEDYRAHERGAGFLAAAGRRARLVRAQAGDAFDAGRAVLAALSDGRGRPIVDGLAFANDHLALGAMLEAQVRAWRVPDDVALIGFGDFPLGRQLGVGLTTVRPPRYEIGAAAARRILEHIEAPTQPARAVSTRLDWTLIERGSTARRP